MYRFLFAMFFIYSPISLVTGLNYTPDWSSLDKRPLPTWYDNVKIGISIHWGVFSVPSYKSELFWDNWKGLNPDKDTVNFMAKYYPVDFTYADFGSEFKAEFFDPNQWAQLIQKSGAKYVVLTSKHHEGYCLWPSRNSWNWNSMDLGSHRDLVGELAEAIRTNTSVKFGLYYSLFEWFNPLYLSDKRSGFADQDFVRSKTIPELYDLVNQYKPEIIWSDGEWEANSTYWNSTEFIAWLYNSSPVKETVVVNDRWGLETSCHHGDFYTCTDNYDSGKLRTHKWEDSLPLDQRSFGYRRDLHLTDVLTIESVISHLVKAVSCGGNILINIGPTKEGTIAPIFEERLLQLGKWLSPNGEAIYGTRPWKFQNDTTNSNVWYTANPISNDVYAILLKYPIGDKTVSISSPTITESTTVSLLGYSGALQWVGPDQGGILIDLSSINDAQVITNWAWVFKLRNVA